MFNFHILTGEAA